MRDRNRGNVSLGGGAGVGDVKQGVSGSEICVKNVNVILHGPGATGSKLCDDLTWPEVEY